MKAFFEPLSGIVRAGPECSKYGDPFEVVVVVSIDNNKCVIKGLTAPKDGLTLAHAKAIVNVLEDMGITSTWERK